jgi:hypothetical protein
MTMQVIRVLFLVGAELYVFEAFRGWTIIVIANYAIYLMLGLILCVYFWNLFVKLRFYGREYRALRMATKSALSGYVTQNLVAICIGFVSAIVMVLLSLLFDFNWLAIGLMTIMDALMRWTRIWEPPIAIYLGGSAPEQFKLCAQIVDPMWPLRIATLLQQRDRSWSSWLVSLSDLRSFRSESTAWIEIVSKLMKLVRVIIVDSRSKSVALVEEIEAIKRGCLQYKTIFVGDDTSVSHEYLEQLGATTASGEHAFLKVDPARLRSFVIFNFAISKSKPSPSRPLSKFHKFVQPELKRWAGRSLEHFDVR